MRTATYGPGIDQSQHAKSVSHIITIIITDIIEVILLHRIYGQILLNTKFIRRQLVAVSS